MTVSLQLKFRDVRWQDFMSRVVDDVCNTLGVNTASGQPECILHSLVLHEAGAQYVFSTVLYHKSFKIQI